MKGTVKLRGKSWSYTVDIGKDPLTGKRKQKSKAGFSRKKDAEAALRKLLIQQDENDLNISSSETFSSFIKSWFHSHYKKRIKETTVSSREYLMEKHLIRDNPFSHKKLSDITVEDIDAFYNLKLEEDFSTSYIRKMHQMLYQVFAQAVKWRKVKNNPVQDADPPGVQKEEMVIWSFEEIHRFLQYCKGERLYLTFLLALYTGMRRGEILGLKWDDIDVSKKVMRVERSMSYIPNKGYVFTNLKTKSSRRYIPIPDLIVKELIAHKSHQDVWKERLGNHYNDMGLVNCLETGNPQDPRNVLRVMHRIMKSADVKKIRFHDLRHTHASILISEGVDLVKVAARLGHANPKITLEVYSHLIPNQDNEVADIFQEAIEKFCEQNVSKPSFDDELLPIVKKQKKPAPLATQGIQAFSRYDSDRARTDDPHPVNAKLKPLHS